MSPAGQGQIRGLETGTAEFPLTAPASLPHSSSQCVTCLGAEHIPVGPFCDVLVGLFISGRAGQQKSSNQEI